MFAAVAIVAICTGLVLYRMHLTARDRGKLLSFTQQAVQWVPAGGMMLRMEFDLQKSRTCV